MDKEIYEKIVAKKEFSRLPKEDVEMAFKKFDNERYSDEEKVKLTRDLLRKVYSAFTSDKLLKARNYDSDWILKKHISTKERFPYYEEIYDRILKGFKGRVNIIDLGAGVNGFSYKYFGGKVYYLAIEAIGQLVSLMNRFFDREKLNARAVHMSLFQLEKVKQLIKEIKGKKIVFLFKTIDSLEMLKRDFSKELLAEISPLVDRIIVSFATKSLGRKKKFYAKRDWIVDFIKENFEVKDDFELGGERYLVFCK